VQAAVIYALAPRGLALLAAYGFGPEAQRWLVGAALLPIAVGAAAAFCPINDLAVLLARRFGASVVAACDQIAGRMTRPIPRTNA